MSDQTDGGPNGRLTSALDRALDLTIAPGFSRIGWELRRRTWPDHGALPRLDGRTVLVTGATSGIGQAAAAGFAELGARVLLLARDPAKGNRVRSEITAQTGSSKLAVIEGDLADLGSIERAVAQITEQEDALHVLVNNAGAMPPERTLSADGFELTFATNVLGTFALTERLIPLLEASAAGASASSAASPSTSRIINVSSGGMYGQALDLDDLQTERKDYEPASVYARTKRAEVLLTEVWAERLAARGITAHSMHPGWADTPGVQDALPTFRKLTKPILRTPQQGADTIVWLGSAPEPEASPGGFWHDRRQRPINRLPKTASKPGDAERLYELCLDLSGLRHESAITTS